MDDDSSTICGDDIEQFEAPSPVARVIESRKTGVYAPELAHAEQQLAQLQKRLALVWLPLASLPNAHWNN